MLRCIGHFGHQLIHTVANGLERLIDGELADTPLLAFVEGQRERAGARLVHDQAGESVDQALFTLDLRKYDAVFPGIRR